MQSKQMGTTATETMTGVAPATTQNRWTRSEARWKDVIRPYTREEVERLRGSVNWGPGDQVTFLATGAETNGAFFLCDSEDQFENAEGDRGMVMVVFTL